MTTPGLPTSLIGLIGEPIPKRREELEKLAASPKTSPTYPVKLREKTENLTIHRVALGFPKYRLGNGRTLTLQREHVARTELPEDFFAKENQEEDEVQLAQHQILVKLARTGGDDDLFKFFGKEGKKQDEPLILDESGYVVNGNRRLATFRELYSQGRPEYSHFEFVDIVILPHGMTEDDILEVEAELQLKRDIRASYDWASEAYMIREQRNTKDDAVIAKRHDITVPSMKNMLEELGLAEEYLEAIGSPNTYSLLANREQAFKTLRTQLGQSADLDTETKIRLYKKIVFSMLKREQRDGRIHATIPLAKEALPEICRLAHAGEIVSSVELEKAVSSADAEAEADPVDSLFGDETLTDEKKAERDEQKAVQAVLSMIEEENGEKVEEKLIKTAHDVIEDIEEKKRVEKDQTESLKLVERANTCLTNALSVIGRQDPAKAKQVAAQIDNIETSLSKIREWLNEHAK